eukprot:CAMPEP_0203816006 /NCGR_PEP_ID=MMETSP0115-20131106/14174_1 /ASSEMBLY_ACC=CAM_ASM_000227 /TAXON_ID=33651 /ORGANISM="Bicosoecid sp, Strain ms1" /LENGTH=368 /DNA_ID=CAMNT_0050724903 /DNA_START=27 /DNA_END=1133 /DNA_ORIENTATION=-
MADAKASGGAGGADGSGTPTVPGSPTKTKLDPTQLQCRFYEKKFPDVEELVMVNVKSIAEMGAYVTLLEYNNIEGMIMLSELSRRRIRSINKLVRVGKNEVVMVIRVDKEKGYIDLSKRRVAPEDVAACEEKFAKAKHVHSILRHVSESRQIPLEDMYKMIGWPLYAKFKHAFDAFKTAIADPEAVYKSLGGDGGAKAEGAGEGGGEGPEEVGVARDLWEETLKNIRRRLTPQAIKLRADVQLTCFQGEGIEAIRAALLKGMEHSTEHMPMQIKLIAPPLYVLLTQSMTKEAGVSALSGAIDAVKTEIEKRGGTFALKMAPRVTSQRDESELTRLMEQLEKQNTEVAGDDEDEEGGEGGGAGEAAAED